MIVQPDFLDHWKVSALAGRIGRLEAITALLALWAHCQQRRLWRFEFTDLMLAGICRFTGDATLLKNTLLELRLIDSHPEGGYEVHEWAEVNASLVHNWEAGSRGGRPKKEPLGNPRVNPAVMPRETLGKPEAKPIREEERRADQTREEPPPPIVPQGTWGGSPWSAVEVSPEPGHWSPSAAQCRVAGWFQRRATTPWSRKEILAWDGLQPVDDDELDVLESYYRTEPQGGRDYRRRDLLTLLCNWTGEVDRARRAYQIYQSARDELF